MSATTSGYQNKCKNASCEIFAGNTLLEVMLFYFIMNDFFCGFQLSGDVILYVCRST